MESVPIYCINLDKATDRWERIQRRLAGYGLEATRWNARTPAELEGHVFASHLDTVQCACALSHFSLWEHCVAQGYDRVLILEDDAVFRKDWVPIVNERLSDPAWVGMFLNAAEEVAPLSTWVPAVQQCMAAAYLLTRPALVWLTTTFRSCIYASDHMTMILQARAPCITYFPWLVIQEGRDSYIQKKDHFDADVAKVRRLLAAANYSLDHYDL
jgi:GR25 family glycosyltransferase involved in LPS biosynthesis